MEQCTCILHLKHLTKLANILFDESWMWSQVSGSHMNLHWRHFLLYSDMLLKEEWELSTPPWCTVSNGDIFMVFDVIGSCCWAFVGGLTWWCPKLWGTLSQEPQFPPHQSSHTMPNVDDSRGCFEESRPYTSQVSTYSLHHHHMYRTAHADKCTSGQSGHKTSQTLAANLKNNAL